MDSLEEMDKSLEKYNFSKLNEEEIENPNRPITSTEKKLSSEIFQQTKAQDQMGLLGFSISSSFSFEKLYFSKDLSISSKLSILLAYSYC